MAQRGHSAGVLGVILLLAIFLVPLGDLIVVRVFDGLHFVSWDASCVACAMAKKRRSGGGGRGGGSVGVFEGFDSDSSEREREEAKKAEEHAREEAKKAEEELREAEKKDSEKEHEDSKHEDDHTDHASDASSKDRDDDDHDRHSTASESSDKGQDGASRDSSREGGNHRSDSRGSSASLSQPLPRTMEELFRRMFAGNDQQKGKGEKSADAKRSNGSRADLTVPGFPSSRRAEVLALNADRKAIERAKALGFAVARPTGLGRLKLEVTRLVAPEGMTIEQADTLLKREVPNAAIARNERYRIYRTATGTAARQPGGTGVEDAGSRCSEERCFGPRLIGWKPELRSCAAGIDIGVIDTAVDTTHPAFKGKAIEVGHPGRGERKPAPLWHGTGVLALLAGDEASGIPGLVPNARFAVADVFFAGDDGQPTTDTLSLLAALDWLDQRQVKIINMSLSGPRDALVEKAISSLARKGTIFVAAAGNDGPAAPPSYPAAYPAVIAVTAVGRDLAGYRHANHGDYIDVAAPGVGIWTALPEAKAGYHSGTSFAVPYVTATLAALYRQLPRADKGEALRHVAIKDLGAPGRDRVYGAGLLVAPATCGNSIATADRSARSVEGPRESLPWLRASVGR